jgi:hypothetical protein
VRKAYDCLSLFLALGGFGLLHLGLDFLHHLKLLHSTNEVPEVVSVKTGRVKVS